MSHDIAKRLFEKLQACGGYYRCPKDLAGKRLGPLVGYAGTYDAPDGTKKQWVGDEYFDFAPMDEQPKVLQYFADYMADIVTKDQLNHMDVLCSMPLGGYSFGHALALSLDRKVIRAEKKVTALATPTSREQSELVFARHSVGDCLKYAVVEDVCNNFSTTEQAIKLIDSLGGRVSLILCLLNRSIKVNSAYYSHLLCCNIPVISVVRQMVNEYAQDDPLVADDVKSGNVVWKPKNERPFLQAQMERFK